MKNKVLTIAGIILIISQVFSQDGSSVYVDINGIMRWSGSEEEVSLFGVNYTTPFAHAFRAHNYIDVDHKKAIDDDVYHFARMGLDAYRCHIWDSEISDSLGNIIPTAQLDAFDYLISRLKERGIKSILTPLKFGSNGYPEPGTPSPGFSKFYGKQACINNPETWPFQERYLVQFLEHVNPYTGFSYKDDQDIIAIEINNEPGHKNAELTRDYLETMIHAIKSAGCRKPIFYNMSHNFHVTDEFLDADLQGGTFQWYPSGLVAGHEQKGNFLPNIDEYPISFNAKEKFGKMAKMVYEFDPADIGRSYTYPVMARSFREAGFQFATQFAYDPLHIAWANTEYQTHYLNLAFAPQKGLSIMIASEVFHQMPLNTDPGEYPSNMQFDDFRISYKEDLAELVSETTFLYTNSTESKPPAMNKLVKIAGYGNSAVIDYPGTGAYFLDRIEEGIWRLEVMPDAVWIRDPFERASLKKQVSVILWKEWDMSIYLEDLGEGFDIRGINHGNEHKSVANGTKIKITPGSYLLTRAGKKNKYRGNEKWNNIFLNEFVAPGENCKTLKVLHDPPPELTAGRDCQLKATILTPDWPISVRLVAMGLGWRSKVIEMTHKGGYLYTANIPAEILTPGYFNYRIIVETTSRTTTWPAGIEGSPGDWDFYARESWKIRVVNNDAPIYLFDAHTDAEMLTMQGRRERVNVIPATDPSNSILEIKNINLKQGNHDYSIRFFMGDKIEGRKNDLDLNTRIVVSGSSLNEGSCPLQVALVMADGTCYGGRIDLGRELNDYILHLDALDAVRLALLPNAYPRMMPYWFEHPDPQPFNIKDIEGLQISVGPGIPENEYDKSFGFSLERIWLDFHR